MTFGRKFERGLQLMMESIVEAQSGVDHSDALTMQADLGELANLRGRPAF
jgi:hypothetical protein